MSDELEKRDIPLSAISMTLRDYFAGQAMQAMMTDPNLDMGCNTVATLSYRMADAMMKEKTDGL